MYAMIIFLQFAAPAFAVDALEVKVVHEYSENRAHLHKKGKTWICDTELRQEVELVAEPASLSLFPKGKKQPGRECKSRFYGVKISGKKKHKWDGCADDPAVRPFLKALNKECGR